MSTQLTVITQGSGTDVLIKSIVPVTTTIVITEAKTYTDDTAAATDATYLNSLNNGNTYFVGHVPRPH